MNRSAAVQVIIDTGEAGRNDERKTVFLSLSLCVQLPQVEALTWKISALFSQKTVIIMRV